MTSISGSWRFFRLTRYRSSFTMGRNVFLSGAYMGDVNDAREENRRMKARLKIAYSDEAWSMIGEIEGRKRVRLKDSHIKG